jgi:chorismate mutase
MDRLNERLAALLQQRARLALTIGRAKRRRGLAAADPARERAMLRAASAGAEAGFSKRELKRLLRAVFAASRALVVRERRGR